MTTPVKIALAAAGLYLALPALLTLGFLWLRAIDSQKNRGPAAGGLTP